jgi:D-alanyl-D-alanine dipeptidase
MRPAPLRQLLPSPMTKASKPTRCQEENLVAADVAEGAQFAVVAVTLAQQAGGGIAAAVGEFREMHRDHGEVVDVGGNLGQVVLRRQPDAQRRAVFVFAMDQAGFLRLPDREWHQQRTDRQADFEGRLAVDQTTLHASILQATILDRS